MTSIYMEITPVSGDDDAFIAEIKDAKPKPSAKAIDIARAILPKNFEITDAKFITKEEYDTECEGNK